MSPSLESSPRCNPCRFHFNQLEQIWSRESCETDLEATRPSWLAGCVHSVGTTGSYCSLAQPDKPLLTVITQAMLACSLQTSFCTQHIIRNLCWPWMKFFSVSSCHQAPSCDPPSKEGERFWPAGRPLSAKCFWIWVHLWYRVIPTIFGKLICGHFDISMSQYGQVTKAVPFKAVPK